MAFIFYSGCVWRGGQDGGAAGALLSILRPPLFIAEHSGRIIATFNYSERVGEPCHKYSLDVLLKSTVRTLGFGWDCTTWRVCVHALLLMFTHARLWPKAD